MYFMVSLLSRGAWSRLRRTAAEEMDTLLASGGSDVGAKLIARVIASAPATTLLRDQARVEEPPEVTGRGSSRDAGFVGIEGSIGAADKALLECNDEPIGP